MAYTIAQAAAQMGVHPTTIRRQIRAGKLSAQLVNSQWIIHEDAIGEAMAKVRHPAQEVNSGYADAANPLIAMLERQIEEKDRQIRELHVLLQGAQEQTQRMLSGGVPRGRRWWWPF